MAAGGRNVLLISPRFEADCFWAFKLTCTFIGARYPSPPLGLITVAALLPSHLNLRLIDRNTDELTAADIEWADLVLTGGMLTQQRDMLEVIRISRHNGKPVAVGGPDVTSSPHVYAEADFRVLGEAEGVIDRFVDAWQSGATRGLFEAEKFQADVTRSPVPRYDLLHLPHYFQISVQFSRGCPFNCEFCDIIELYGRVPRVKTSEQILAELNEIYRLGHRGSVDFVDDNLIGNKKALRQLLPAVIGWQRQRGYPFAFATQMSVNAADDEPLLKLLREANFYSTYVGIESPDTGTLVAVQKKQNIKRQLHESIGKIHRAGLFVLGGFIIGFDSEKGNVAGGIIDCIEMSAIPTCLMSLLYALPQTQLTRRLEREGRLHADHDLGPPGGGDQNTCGLNFETKRPRRDMLDDYRTIIAATYGASQYFGRLRKLGRVLSRPARDLRVVAREFLGLRRVLWYMTVTRPDLRRHFWHTLLDCAVHNPAALKCIIFMIGMYAHLDPYYREVARQTSDQIARIDAGEWAAPAKRQAVAA